MVELLFQGLGSFMVLLEEGCDAVIQYNAALFCGKRRGSCSKKGWSLFLRQGYCFLSNGGVRGGGVVLIEEGVVKSVVVVKATNEGSKSESIVGGEGIFFS